MNFTELHSRYGKEYIERKNQNVEYNMQPIDSNHAIYSSWKDSDYFDEWLSHVNLLCKSLKNQIDITE